MGGVIAATLMVAAVNARTSEIGLRRAVGALHADIARQFLTETALSLGAGGMAGIIVGLVLSELVAQHMKLSGLAPVVAVLVGLCATCVTGIAAGVLPARRAARLLPIEALR